MEIMKTRCSEVTFLEWNMFSFWIYNFSKIIQLSIDLSLRHGLQILGYVNFIIFYVLPKNLCCIDRS